MGSKETYTVYRQERDEEASRRRVSGISKKDNKRNSSSRGKAQQKAQARLKKENNLAAFVRYRKRHILRKSTKLSLLISQALK